VFDPSSRPFGAHGQLTGAATPDLLRQAAGVEPFHRERDLVRRPRAGPSYWAFPALPCVAIDGAFDLWSSRSVRAALSAEQAVARPFGNNEQSKSVRSLQDVLDPVLVEHEPEQVLVETLDLL